MLIRLSWLIAALQLVNAMILQPATSRHSLNYGRDVPHAVHHTHSHTPSPALLAFNARSDFASLSGNTPDDAGLALARAFLAHLHPRASFRLSSGYLSAHSGVYHAHFVQLVDGKEVFDALVNINIDVTQRSVLSYGDAAWKGIQTCQSAFTNSGRNQVVLSPTGEEDCAPSYDVAKAQAIVDPRIALVSFLSIGDPSLNIEAIDPETITISHPFVAQDDSPSSFLELHNVPGALQPVKAKLGYVQTDEASVAQVWRFEYLSNSNAYEACVEAETGKETLFVADWQKDYTGVGSAAWAERSAAGESYAVEDAAEVELEASYEGVGAKPEDGARPDAVYRVFPWGVNDPYEGPREVVVNPADKVASPLGWHEIPAGKHSGYPRELSDKWEGSSGWSRAIAAGAGANFTDTRGNNVYAQNNPDGGSSFELNYRPAAHNLNFTFPLGWHCTGKNCTGKIIDPLSYLNVSITNLFYTCNEIHDFSERYGFDEASGNFQARNFGTKGLGNDAVVANAQDGSGMNNANFMTPPDGQQPRMRMYVWDGAEPWRDGDLDAGIVIHEYTHGISTRLTGGPANSGCLGWGEAGGAGEGWGDFLATMVRMHKKKVVDWDMGSWASHRLGGIRKYPYSTNSTINPDTYKAVDKMFGVHDIGAVWAEMLFVVAEGLVKAHGFDHDLFPPAPLEMDATQANQDRHNSFYKISKDGKKYPAKGNTLAIQLVIDGMKLQPCRPKFVDMRDAILAADKALTGGENFCNIEEHFARRGLGPKAAVIGSTPWGGGIRTEDFTVSPKCKQAKH